MRLDESQPYAEIHGPERTLFEQNGRLFLPNGHEVGAPPDADDEAPPEPQSSGGLRRAHWKHLKAQVEAYGGEWTNSEDAVAFLEGRSA
jgi:hypothetical protein